MLISDSEIYCLIPGDYFVEIDFCRCTCLNDHCISSSGATYGRKMWQRVKVVAYYVKPARELVTLRRLRSQGRLLPASQMGLPTCLRMGLWLFRKCECGSVSESTTFWGPSIQTSVSGEARSGNVSLSGRSAHFCG